MSFEGNCVDLATSWRFSLWSQVYTFPTSKGWVLVAVDLPATPVWSLLGGSADVFYGIANTRTRKMSLRQTWAHYNSFLPTARTTSSQVSSTGAMNLVWTQLSFLLYGKWVHFTKTIEGFSLLTKYVIKIEGVLGALLSPSRPVGKHSASWAPSMDSGTTAGGQTRC